MHIYLIDGHAIAYRAYFAYGVPDMQNSKGFPTKIPYGFTQVIRKLLNDYVPDGLIVTFDTGAPTFRHEQYAEYKANRDETPDDLILQMPVVKDIVKAYGIPIFEKDGFEADDLMGTLSTRLAAKGHDVTIVTSDKDACQLVTERVKLMDPRKGYAVLGIDEVKLKLGVNPNQVIDYLALVGDSSDNIPGVPGIGPKNASQLLNEYGSMQGLYERVSELKPSAKKESLINNAKQADLSYQLATIDCDVDIDICEKELLVSEPNVEQLTQIFTELEFNNFLKTLPATESKKENSLQKYELISKKTQWRKLLATLKKQKSFAFDFETTSVNPMLAEPVGISFSFKDHEAAFVLFDNHVSKKSELSCDVVLGELKTLFEDSKVSKLGQNIKYEMLILKCRGIELRGIGNDTMVASYLLNPAKPNHNLNDLALEHLNEKLTSITELIGKGQKEITMDQVDVSQLYPYGCQDSDVVWRLSKVLRTKIAAAGLTPLLDDMEIPLIHVLAQMEFNGIAIDVPYLDGLSKKMDTELGKLTKEIYKIADCEFNIRSPKQLAEVLFDKLGLPVIRKTKTGPSTDADVLSQLISEHELPAYIVNYRETAKLKSTYVDTMPLMVNPNTKRIHSSFNQTVAATGRLSSSDPNLQNIPIRSQAGRQIRKAFKAGKGNALLCADYSQIELRVLAHFSKDEHLQTAFKNREDIHTYTASLIFGEDIKNISPQMRNEAKTVNFGVLYGMSPFGLSKSLHISQLAAKDFIDAYFDRYPKVRQYLDATIEYAKEFGFVETVCKRRRYIPDILSPNGRMRQFSERTAINAPIQGTASDLIKIAMVKIHQRLVKKKQFNRLLIQVHDELVFELPQSEVAEFGLMVRNEMEGAVALDVPIEVTLKTGVNWLDLEALKI
ncbi:MAG: DNA polymerase-1 [Candidatus Omnitrophota bacterium]|jgi:DNA polymerase-1